MTRGQHAVERAATALRHAQDELRRAVAAAYPIGTIVRVDLGRARVRGRVTGFSRWDPETVCIVNLDTLKPRAFCATFSRHNVEIVR
jgi:hypothetical protein